MFSHFTNIVNKLKALNKDYTQEKVMKVLRALPKKKWRPMVIAIQNIQDLENLSLDELMGMLQTYEVELQDDELEELEESRETRKKTIALKMTHESDKEESEDEQILLLSRHFHKFLKSKKGRKPIKGQPSRDNKGKNYSNEKSNEVIFCECRKPGHIKPNCPNLSKEGKKKKAYKAEETWDESVDSSDEQSGDEHTYIALMAASDQEEDKGNSTFFDNMNCICEENNEFDELYGAFQVLFEDRKRIVKEKKKALGKQIDNLQFTLNELTTYVREQENEIKGHLQTIEKLQKENKDLSQGNAKLTSALKTFTKGQRNLDTLLRTPRRDVHNMEGLGYKGSTSKSKKNEKTNLPLKKP
ncbi:uncharacterized protein LOC122063360 [Macadamia integrifolia]|uniref:uncharacterized protein LOC122063360 n=1 Tax=Macadamia integrifolia TaxID=60698 RepID=UPI001C4FC91D|nr:uncharacterized protein LOC122063360 [Macadamia integrifolia]